MAKKKNKTSKNFRLKHPCLVGGFYKIHDANGGHPIRVYFAIPEEDIYFIQRFSTKPRKDRVKLKHNIDPERNNDQWLVKKPEIVGYDDIKFEQNYINFRVHPEDEPIIVKYQKFNLKKMCVASNQ